TDDTELTPLLAALLSLPTDKYRNQEQLPERRKDATVAALLRRLKTLTIQSPVLIVLEDAHWLDPSSTEFFGAVIETVHSLPVLLVISHRPEYEPAWRSPGHETRLSLSRLARRDCAEIVEQMAAGKHLPTEVFEQILSKSDGIPLFIEELTKSVLESDALVEKSNDGVSRGTFRQTAVPDTLQDSLMARLDRLGPVKGIAQTAAVIGREFPFDWLSALSPLDDHALSEALTRLEAAGIISRSGTSPESVFVFRHALVRDAAYNSILLAKRRELHAQAALLLESTYPSPVESQPELIAQHYDEAQTPEKAVKYWHLAGERAVERAANLEAVRHLRSALKCIPSLPEGRGRDELELRLLTLLSPAQLVTRSRAATDIATTLGRARDLAEQLDDPERLVPVTLGMWLIRMTRGEIDAAQKLTQELFQQAERTADNGFILQAHHAAWTIPMYTGNFEEVLRHVDSGVALYDRGRHGNHAFLYLGHDPLTCALALRSVALWMLGFVDQALDCVARAVDTALESNHPPTLVHALSYEGYLHFLREEPKDVAVVAKRLSSIAVEQELTPGVIAAECLVGWAMARKGEADEGVERLRRSINAYKATGELLHLPQRLSMLADAMSITDRISDALDINAEAQTVAVSTGERWYEGMILCQRAQLLRRLGNDPHLIEMTLCESMGVARRQNAKSVELRAATELARLWIEQGREQDAYDLLVAVCRSFTEGFDTPNLRDAIGLIGELG
ncbi:MAG: hypothetical protein OEQ18_16480, partial [Gammaproteobacteria bacterium]|nr:hypothetical protein [Gammaproteobacteria bacterium]